MYNSQLSMIYTLYFRFPVKAQDSLLRKWKQAIRRDVTVGAKRVPWEPTTNCAVCCDHFLPNDFQPKPGTLKPLLKPDAVPSIFVTYHSPLQVSFSQLWFVHCILFCILIYLIKERKHAIFRFHKPKSIKPFPVLLLIDKLFS